MPLNNSRPPRGDNAAIEDGSLSELEAKQIVEALLRRAAQERIRSYFAHHCRRPLGRIHDRLQKIEGSMRKVLGHVR